MDNLQNNTTTMNLQPLFMSMFTNNAEDPFHSNEMIENQRDFLYLCSIFLIGGKCKASKIAQSSCKISALSIDLYNYIRLNHYLAL